MVKRLSTMRETWVRPLGQEDPLEKEMAIHSSTIAWKIPWTEKLGRLQSMGSLRVGHDWATSLVTNVSIYERIIYLTFNILKEKRNRNSTGYITKLGFNQHPDSNSAGKSPDIAHLESQLGEGPRQLVHSVGKTSKTGVQGSRL